MTNLQTTHAPGCWDWGPKHYECAVGQIERDEDLLRQALKALLGQRGEPDWHTGTDRENAIAALRERLGEKVMKEQTVEEGEQQ